MYALHPKTGKEIRILNTDASRWKDQKTLSFSPLASPWDSVWTSTLEDGSPPTFRILLGKPSASTLKDATKSRYVFVRETVGAEMIKRFGLFTLEDLHLSYPQLGEEWDGSVEDAAAMIAHLFLYQRVYIPEGTPSRLSIPIHREKPEPLWLITQYYKSTSKERANEIDLCLQKNVENPLISGILLLNETHFEMKHSKVKEVVIGHRITYADVMSAVSSLPDNALVAFANADICFDPISWRSLWSVNLTDVCIALLRYDVPSSGTKDATLFGPRADSQDSWVVRAADVKSRTLTGPQFDIPFGVMGCDNAFALEMLRQKFCVINPCHTLITWHYHQSNVRTYDKDDVIDRTTFHYIHPSGLHDMKPLLDTRAFTKNVYPLLTLQTPIRGKGATTWIHSMGKQGKEWKMDGSISFPEERVLRLQSVFQTPQGLAYDSNTMYVGDKEAQKKWASSPIRVTLPTLKSEKGFIIPWPTNAEAKREVYILKYLSKVLRLRELSGWKGGDFFCPDLPTLPNAIKLFRWGVSPLPLMKYEPDIQIWHEEAFTYVYSGEEILPEDMDALRRGLGQFWLPESEDEKRIVIVEGGTLLGKVSELEEALENEYKVFVVYAGKTSPERLLATLSGAWGVICPSGLEASGWNWMLPKGAYVFEVDSKDDASFKISVAASLQHRFVGKSVLEEIDSLNEGKPVLWVPSNLSDGFSELIDMWAKKGYICKREHSTADVVWWGEVGNVLLYDKASLITEYKRKHMLTDLLGWARHPKMVEEFVEQGFHETPWEKRNGFANTLLEPQDCMVSLSNSLYAKVDTVEQLIECLAMSCIPLMSNSMAFSEALKEGEHYLTESKDTFSREDWERMSSNGHAWWKRICSCEGSFELTQKLVNSMDTQ
jgi:hypothetical protein